MRSIKPLAFVFLAMGGLAIAQSTAPEALLDAIRQSITDRSVEEGRKQAALKALEDHAQDPSAAATAALKELYPEFAAALPDLAGNLEKLRQWTKGEDSFLAAESSYYLGRTLFSQRNYEEALPLMESLRGPLGGKTFRGGEALYYLGMCQAQGLRKAEALENLQMFLEDYPSASERLQLSAKATIDGLKNNLEGTPEDIADHMDFAQRRLSLTDSGKGTQDVQQKVVDMLDKLIKDLEDQNNQNNQGGGQQDQQQGQGKGQQGQANQNNGQGGNASAQEAPKSAKRTRGAAKSAWDDLRQRDRGTDALSGAKSKYPPRYRELVDQYFNDLQSEGSKE